MMTYYLAILSFFFLNKLTFKDIYLQCFVWEPRFLKGFLVRIYINKIKYYSVVIKYVLCDNWPSEQTMA